MERRRQVVNVSRRANAPRRGTALVAVALALGGCSWMPSLPALPGSEVFSAPRQIRGQMIDDETLRQITVGVSTRSDVTALLGSPTATPTFSEDEWYYIGGVTRQRPAQTQALEDQQVVVVRFDPRGTVQDVRRIGREDGRDVAFVARETPSPGNERTFLQQLFGNIGRLGPGLGNQPQTGPGSPSPSGR
jgi:outer membrane protein assembly factor BamE (lipoprotein component of BamABCDE complex)